MKRRNFIAAAGACTLAGTVPAWAQTYPTKVVRLIVPFPPGGPTDSFARLYAESLAEQLGQNVIVENKAGASGVIGSMEVKNAKPDGYTLLFGTASTHALYNLIEDKPRYDANTDFDYVAALGGAPVAFAVSNSMPDTLKGLAETAKASPGKLKYGSPGTGTLLHVATEQMLQAIGAEITHVPYKGGAPALQDLMGGSLDMVVGTLGSILPLHKDGRVRMVAVATAKRLSLAPDIPTVAESAGLSSPLTAVLWNVVAVPGKTPDPIRVRLAQASKAAMEDAKTADALGKQFMFPDLHIGNKEATEFVKTEAAKYQPVVTKLGDAIKRQ